MRTALRLPACRLLGIRLLQCAPERRQNTLEACGGLSSSPEAAPKRRMLRCRQAVAHRDLKLENVLEDGRGACKLCDFGSISTAVLDCASASRRERLDAEDEISRRTSPRRYTFPVEPRP